MICPVDEAEPQQEPADENVAEEAEALFRKAAATSPVGGIRLAYVLHRAGKDAEAKAALDAAAAKPIAFALPFRRESLPALNWAIQAAHAHARTFVFMAFTFL